MSPTRTAGQLAYLVQELLRLPSETGWVEDKHGNTDPEEIGRYISQAYVDQLPAAADPGAPGPVTPGVTPGR